MTKRRIDLLKELRRHLASKAGIIPTPRELADPVATYSALVEAITELESIAELKAFTCDPDANRIAEGFMRRTAPVPVTKPIPR